MKKSSLVLLTTVLFAVARTSDAGLIGYYGLNEGLNPSTGTTAVDSSGHQDGAYEGAVGPQVGVASADALLFGTAAWFNGTDDVVNLGTGLGQLTNNFTVAAWIKPDELDRFGYIISNNNWDNVHGWGLFVRGLKNNDGQENKLDLLAPGQAGLTTTNPFLTSSDIGKWTHVAVTVTNSEGVNVYKNGQLFETLGSYMPVASNDSYWVGCGYGAGDGPWLGGIDEVRVYDNVLTGGQIGQLAGVPEPSTILLLTTGLFSLLAYAWRKRKQLVIE